MTRTLTCIILLVFTASACSQVKTDVPDNPAAKATQAIVEEYIQAYETYDISRCADLFSADAWYGDVSNEFEATGNLNIASALREEIVLDTFRVKFQSYLVTVDGRFAVIQAIYSHRNFSEEPWDSAPYIIILEIEDGKIIRETLYTSKNIF